jgi:hypothetical protein
MVTTLNVKCPYCEQVLQIFLSTRVSIIVLNCPSCQAPIMYLRRKIFPLDPQRLKRTAGSSRTSLVSRLLDQIADAETAARCRVKKDTIRLQRNNSPCRTAVRKLKSRRQEVQCITEDDCTNLRIELELCTDSQAFINRL